MEEEQQEEEDGGRRRWRYPDVKANCFDVKSLNGDNSEILDAARRPADPVYLYPSDLVRSRMKDAFLLQGVSCAPEGR